MILVYKRFDSIDRAGYIEIMTTNILTEAGIIVRNGEIIAKNVNVKMRYNEEYDLVDVSYFDNDGVYHQPVMEKSEYSFMNTVDNMITGLLPKNEDWYLFWDASVFSF